MRCFYNARGKAYGSLDEDGVLHKSEKQKDRLRVTGGRSHALDADLLDEALQAGGKTLEITEKGVSGETRIFRIPLGDIRRYGKRLTLAGVSRWTIPLPACELVRGPEEEWRAVERAELLKASIREKEVQDIRAVQGMLFSDAEKDYWRTRLVHET
jgi:hypothetical protein